MRPYTLSFSVATTTIPPTMIGEAYTAASSATFATDIGAPVAVGIPVYSPARLSEP